MLLLEDTTSEMQVEVISAIERHPGYTEPTYSIGRSLTAVHGNCRVNQYLAFTMCGADR